MEFNASTITAIQKAINPDELHQWFWLERKILRAAVDNINFITTPCDYPYEGASKDIIKWAQELGFTTNIIKDKVMISW